MSDAPPPRRDANARFFAAVLSFGWVMPAAIAAGAGVGWLVDRVIGSFPVATIVVGLIGALAGFRQLYREFIALSEDEEP